MMVLNDDDSKKKDKSISSIEELEKDLIRIPRSWALAFIAALLLVGTLFVWGFSGSIPEYSRGRGVIILGQRFWLIESETTGIMGQIYCFNGMTVKKGALLADIRQQDLKMQIDAKRKEAEDTRNLLELKQRWDREKTLVEDNSSGNRRKNLTKTIELSEKRLAEMSLQLKDYEELLAKRYISVTQYSSLKGQYNQLLESITNLRTQLDSLPIDRLHNRSARAEDIEETRARLVQVEKELGRLEAEYRTKSKVYSPIDAVVTQTMAVNGMAVTEGAPLFQLEFNAGNKDVLEIVKELNRLAFSHNEGGEDLKNVYQDLEVVAYLEAGMGANVRKGMSVTVMPDNMKKEESGSLKGKVIYAEERPTTRLEADRILKNKDLLASIWQENMDYYFVAIRLDRDESGGYLWTSKRGLNRSVNVGTLASIEVSLYDRRPIDLLIPYLKKLVLGVGE